MSDANSNIESPAFDREESQEGTTANSSLDGCSLPEFTEAKNDSSIDETEIIKKTESGGDEKNNEQQSSKRKRKNRKNNLDSKGVLEKEPLLDISYLQENATSHIGEEENNKREEPLEIRDELDFEVDKDSGEEEEGEEGEEDGEETSKPEEPINKEEGELSEEDEDESLLRQEPKTVCRFFNKGQCTWGTNCRFLHPGVSDKGNYNMFAPPKPPSVKEDSEASPEKEKPKEVRRFIPEPSEFETAWERGLRHAKEMKKRASKRKETDADFEEKRFNLSLGQSELDRENDYYTRPASPVYKPTDEVIEYLDPYEKQAIRHFRGGHFENLEVRYNVDPAYPNRGAGHVRSRREKFEREVTERISRRTKVLQTVPAVGDDPKIVKEKRYPKPPRAYKEERPVEGKGEAEVWADPWARRKTPVNRVRKKKIPHTRSYSHGSSSRSSRSSGSSSYSRSSYSRSRSHSSHSSRSSRSASTSRSRSITPPIHPRIQRGGTRGGRGIRGGRGGGDRGGRQAVDFQRNGQTQYPNQYPNQNQYPNPPLSNYPNQFHNPHFNQAPNYPPNHPLAPAIPSIRAAPTRRTNQNSKDGRAPPLQLKQEPNRKYPLEERMNIVLPHKADLSRQQDARERLVPHKSEPPRLPTTDPRERVDMFGRTIRKDVPRSPTPRSTSRSPVRVHGKRKFSLSPSRSRSDSRSYSGSSASRSRSRSFSKSRSGSGSPSPSRSGSRSSSSASVPPVVVPKSPPVNKKKEKVIRKVPVQGTVSYGESVKAKAIDPVKVAGQKQQIKLTLKKTGPVRPVDKTVLGEDDDSGESDTDARILKRRKLDSVPVSVSPAKLPKPTPVVTTVISQPAATAAGSKKPSAARREELLKQLRAVEDAIARKRSKPLG